MAKEINKEGVIIRCRECGCLYIESKEWIFDGNTAKCPYCGAILTL